MLTAEQTSSPILTPHVTYVYYKRGAKLDNLANEQIKDRLYRVNVCYRLLLCLVNFPFHSSFSTKILNTFLFSLTHVIPSHLILILSSYEVDRYESEVM